jgi:hypothetical protein
MINTLRNCKSYCLVQKRKTEYKQSFEILKTIAEEQDIESIN